jgi:hypothetical protein
LVIICYKFNYTLDAVLELTFPQLKCLRVNLESILKAEAGEKNSNTESFNMSTAQLNTLAFENTVKKLKEKTGRQEFDIDEIYKPQESLK